MYLRERIIAVALVYLMHTVLYSYVSVHHVNDNFNLLTDLDQVFPFVQKWFISICLLCCNYSLGVLLTN